MNSQVTVTLSPDEFRSVIREEMKILINRVDPGDALLTRAEVAAKIKKSVQAVKKMEDRGIIKRATKSGQPRYRESEILKLKK